MADARRCSNCRFYQPKYAGVGKCIRENSPGAMFWSPSDQLLVFVRDVFGCIQHEQPAEVKNDTL